jgi:flavin-dependent dehydrogenase
MADVIVGSVGGLNKEIIADTLEKLRKIRPAIGFELLRGGQTGIIPIKSAHSLFVGDNYAATGDAASMPIPLRGSGITNAIISGKMLAETVIDIVKRGKNFDIAELWDYQVKFYHEIGRSLAPVAILKNRLLGYSGKTLDFLFDKKILSAAEFSAGSEGREVVMDKAAVLDKLKKGYTNLAALITLKAAVRKSKTARLHAGSIPLTYQKEEVERWRKKLESFFN